MRRMPTIPARIGVPLVVLFFAIVFFTMTGCTEQAQRSFSDNSEESARAQLADMIIACRDGVEYLVTPGSKTFAVTPHLQPDGSPYPCITMQSPVD